MALTASELKRIIEIVNVPIEVPPVEAISSADRLLQQQGLGVVIHTTAQAMQRHISELLLEEFGSVIEGDVE